LRPPRFLRAVLGVLRRERLERDLDDELKSALAELEAEKIASGLSAAEAKRAAILELGNPSEIKEDVREVRAGFRLEALSRDAALAARRLRSAPGFAAVVVLTLTLGIGGTAAMFSAVEAARSALPFPHSERLVHLWAKWAGGSGNMSFRDFEAIAAESRAFESIAAYETWGGVALSGSGEPQKLVVNFSTADYFPLLGARAEIGRLFAAAENGRRDAAPVAVLSDAAWRHRFGGDAEIVGRRVLLNGTPFEVIGVLPPSFRDLGLAEG